MVSETLLVAVLKAKVGREEGDCEEEVDSVNGVVPCNIVDENSQ